MQKLSTGQPVWDLTFDASGDLTALTGPQFAADVAGSGVQDLFVFSHGWGTSESSAAGLYAAMFPMIVTAAAAATGLGPLGFAGVYWPSLWFPDTPATPPTVSGSTQSADGAGQPEATGSWAVSGADITAALLPGYVDPGQQASLTRLGGLIDEGSSSAVAGESDDQKTQRLVDLQGLLKSLAPAPPNGDVEDWGETALLQADDPVQAFQQTAEIFGSAPPASSEQSLGDWFSSAISGVKDALRVLSYSTMKARAGAIGQAGLGPALAALHSAVPAVRVHLIGHSFGARLVSFGLSGIADPASSPVASLLLLQGAFSHWSFAHAQDNPFGRPGALNSVADRVHGPLVATFSSYDWAVCRWYPKASFLAQQDTEDVAAGRWDGMGCDGYQAVSPSQDLTMPAAGGLDYGLVPGMFYRADAAAVINDVTGQPFAGAHSDIRKPPVAGLAVAAAAAHA